MSQEDGEKTDHITFILHVLFHGDLGSFQKVGLLCNIEMTNSLNSLHE